MIAFTLYYGIVISIVSSFLRIFEIVEGSERNSSIFLKRVILK